MIMMMIMMMMMAMAAPAADHDHCDGVQHTPKGQMRLTFTNYFGFWLGAPPLAADRDFFILAAAFYYFTFRAHPKKTDSK